MTASGAGGAAPACGLGDGIRNLVEYNLTDDPLRFFWWRAARDARRVGIIEHGSRCFGISLDVPTSLALRPLLPPWATLGFDRDDGSIFAAAVVNALAGTTPVRAVVAGAMRLPRRWNLICDIAPPDIFCRSGDDAAQSAVPTRLQRVEPIDDPAQWGMAGVQWFAAPEYLPLMDSLHVAFASEVRARRLVRDRVYDIADLLLYSGFYQIEEERAIRWAWTGPGPEAVLLLPGHAGAMLRYTLFFFGHQIPPDEAHLRISVDDQAWPVRYCPDEMKVEVKVHPRVQRCCTRLTLFQRGLRPTPDGSRVLGLGLHKVRIETLE
jgi:hypothetical protein